MIGEFPIVIPGRELAMESQENFKKSAESSKNTIRIVLAPAV